MDLYSLICAKSPCRTKKKLETAQGHPARKPIVKTHLSQADTYIGLRKSRPLHQRKKSSRAQTKRMSRLARTCDAEPSDDGGGWTRVVRKGRSRSAELQEKFQKLEIKETPDILLATRKDECRPPLTAREELEKLLEDSEQTHHSRAEGERPLRAFSACANTRSFGCDDDAPPNRYAVLRNLGEEARSGGRGHGYQLRL